MNMNMNINLGVYPKMDIEPSSSREEKLQEMRQNELADLRPLIGLAPEKKSNTTFEHNSRYTEIRYVAPKSEWQKVLGL